uniref:Poly [ADP-ribose] polymerase n=1 Tax=Plectus sambesii TaxID=2011161 RepID=A0A914VFI9_9BILA
MSDDKRKDLPYGVEYAKSNRSMCKGCKNPISQESLRMSVRTQSQFFDGLQDNWFHFACFWKRVKNATINEASIRGMDWLKWEDQEKIREKINNRGAGGDDEDESSSSTTAKVEYAKTSRSKCTKCSEKIEKGAVKVGIKSSWYHTDCFLQTQFKGKADSISGFGDLTEEDQGKLKTALEAKNEPKKRKGEESNGDAKPKKIKAEERAEIKEKAALKSQSEALWNLREQMKQFVHKDDMGALLKLNAQEIPNGGVDKMLDRLVDGLLFGALKPCSQCQGQLVFSTSQQSYLCTGHASAWAKCEYSVEKPVRKSFVIPEELHENEWLKAYKVEHRMERVYASGRRSQEIAVSHSIAALSKSKSGSQMQLDRGNGLKSGHSGKSASGKQKVVVKNGTAVDPECDVAEVVHVYRDSKGRAWDAVLGSADLSSNRNSYYKLQLLEHDKMKRYYVFRSWGRTGTTIGGTKTENFGGSLEAAKSSFMELFLDKSGNEWGGGTFEKKPGKLFLMEIDYGGDEKDLPAKPVKPGVNSSLPKAIQDIILMIFDVNNMKQAMKEFEIDIEKMPLGKLKRSQIDNAYKVLTELQNMMAGGKKPLPTAVLDASNRFYTLIPHDFGLEKPKMLNTEEIIKQKTEMLDNLLEIEVAYNILKEEKAEADERDPVDVHYEKLHTRMEVLDKKSEEFERLTKYVQNTHAATHNTFKLQIQDVIKIERDGEGERFAPFKSLHNRQLLWHGSRLTNYAGILSQGLRIAPPEAPVTGYMFGKGVYFADMVSKSANYCGVHSGGEGLMLLCEVALGDMQEELAAKSITKLNKGKHSCKGVGGTMPDPKGQHVDENGVVIPMGKGVSTDRNGLSLLYNEYIVYDVAQVNIKYLLRMKFEPVRMF